MMNLMHYFFGSKDAFVTHFGSFFNLFWSLHLLRSFHYGYFGFLYTTLKVCIVQPRSRLRSFDVPYIFYSKFTKSRAHNLQTFQSGLYMPTIMNIEI